MSKKPHHQEIKDDGACLSCPRPAEDFSWDDFIDVVKNKYAARTKLGFCELIVQIPLKDYSVVEKYINFYKDGKIEVNHLTIAINRTPSQQLAIIKNLFEAGVE